MATWIQQSWRRRQQGGYSEKSETVTWNWETFLLFWYRWLTYLSCWYHWLKFNVSTNSIHQVTARMWFYDHLIDRGNYPVLWSLHYYDLYNTVYHSHACHDIFGEFLLVLAQVEDVVILNPAYKALTGSVFVQQGKQSSRSTTSSCGSTTGHPEWPPAISGVVCRWVSAPANLKPRYSAERNSGLLLSGWEWDTPWSEEVQVYCGLVQEWR